MAKRVYYFREFRCANDHTTHKLVEPNTPIVRCEVCGEDAIKPEAIVELTAAMHGDALDYIDHNLGRDPIHITSKSQRRAIMAANGLEECIRHVPVPGTDKSPYTTDWSKGSMDPQTLENARILTERQAVRKPVQDEVYAPVANAFVHTATPEEVRELIEAIDVE